MRPSTVRWKRHAALAAAVMLTAGLGSPVRGSAATDPLGIGSYQVSGEEVRVTVFNTGDETLAGTVHIRARLDDRIAEASVPVTVHEGQKAFVVAAFPSAVEEIIELGVILDDAPPF